MSITKLGSNRYRFRVMKDGVSYSKVFRGTEAAAKKAHNAYQVDVHRGDIGEQESMKFKVLAQMVIDEYVKPNLRYNTQRIYLTNLNLHILPVLGNKKIASIKPYHIQNFVNDMTKKGFKRNTIQKAFGCIKVCFEYGVKWGFLQRSPCIRINMPQGDFKPQQELISADDIARLISLYEKENNVMHRAAFYLGAYGGMRNSEIRALTIDDLDFARNTIRINKQQGEYLENGVLKRGAVLPKTRSSIRTIYVPQFVMDTMRELIDWLPYIPTSKEIFINTRTGKPISKHCISKRFTSIIQQHEFPVLRFHDLRHIHATLLIHSGVIDKTASKRLGHSKVDITKELYAHNLDIEDKRASDQLLKYVNTEIKKAEGS